MSITVRGRAIGDVVAASALGVVLVLGLAFRLRMLLMDRSLWLDSAMLALNLVEKGYGELLGRLEWNQAAPAGFLLAEKLVGSSLGYSEPALYALPFLAGIGALFLFLVLAVEALGVRLAPLAVAPLAFSSTAVYYSAELKQYSFDLLAAVVLLFAAHRVVTRGFQRVWIGTWSLAAILALWFSHPSILVAAGTGAALVALAWIDRKTSLRTVTIAAGAVAIHFGAVFLLVIGPAAQPDLLAYHAHSFAPVGPSTPGALAWWLGKLAGYGRFPLGYGVWFPLPLALLVIGAFVAPLDRSSRALVALAGLPLLAAILASALHLYPLATGQHDVNARFVLFTLPSACLLIAVGGGWLARRVRFRHLVLLLLGGALALPPLVRMLVWPSYVRQEMRPLVRYLSDHIGSDEPVYVYNPAVPAFLFYTRETPITFIAGAPVSSAAEVPEDAARVLAGRPGWIVIAHDHVGAQDAIVQAAREHGWSYVRKQFPGAVAIRVEPPGS